jgi:hypothetical protein
MRRWQLYTFVMAIILLAVSSQDTADSGPRLTVFPIRTADVAATAAEFAQRLQDWSCEVLRVGGANCSQSLPGVADAYDALMTGGDT